LPSPFPANITWKNALTANAGHEVDINQQQWKHNSSDIELQPLYLDNNHNTQFFQRVDWGLSDGQGVNNCTVSRIKFRLYKSKDYPNINPQGEMKCPLGEIVGRTPGQSSSSSSTGEIRDGILPPSLQTVVNHSDYPRDGLVLDFTASISTDLKILFIGDSVMLQLGEAFHQMVSGSSGNTQRTHIVAPTICGGVSAIWRMTGLLSKSMEGKAPFKFPNHPGGGWSRKDIARFLNHEYKNTTVQRFDVVVFRIMHGWMTR
jgi:hypothetical protein